MCLVAHTHYTSDTFQSKLVLLLEISWHFDEKRTRTWNWFRNGHWEYWSGRKVTRKKLNIKQKRNRIVRLHSAHRSQVFSVCVEYSELCVAETNTRVFSGPCELSVAEVATWRSAIATHRIETRHQEQDHVSSILVAEGLQRFLWARVSGRRTQQNNFRNG